MPEDEKKQIDSFITLINESDSQITKTILGPNLLINDPQKSKILPIATENLSSSDIEKIIEQMEEALSSKKELEAREALNKDNESAYYKLENLIGKIFLKRGQYLKINAVELNTDYECRPIKKITVVFCQQFESMDNKSIFYLENRVLSAIDFFGEYLLWIDGPNVNEVTDNLKLQKIFELLEEKNIKDLF